MKKTESNLTMLNIIFVVSIVVSNMVGCKIIDTGLKLGSIDLILGGGAITYAFTFLCTDVIGEIWGKDEANKAVKRGFIGQLFAIVLVILTQYTPTADQNMQKAYETLLGQSPVFVLGSLCAYFCSQSFDVWVFHKIRNRFVNKPGGHQKRWIWNNASTCTSQVIDTSIYAVIAFGLGMGWFFQPGGLKMVLSIIIGQYLLKLCLALLDTPFFYYFTKKED